MSKTESIAEAMAAELNVVNAKVMAACEATSVEEWGAAVWEDGSPAAAVFNHIAEAYDLVSEWALQIADGELPPQLTMEQINRHNKRSAAESATAGKQEILEALDQKAAVAAARIRPLTEAQLAIVAPLPFMGGETNAERLIQLALIKHAQGHLDAILSARSAPSPRGA
jgi:uncharacterized damage-inducible protein DinB